MSYGCKDGEHFGVEVSLASTNPSKTLTRRGACYGRCTPVRGGVRMPVEGRVYPQHGPFLNPLAFSNIETYSTPYGRSGNTPRSFLLRSSPGTSLTMQPISKPAQSMYAKPLRNGTRARSSR